LDTVYMAPKNDMPLCTAALIKQMFSRHLKCIYLSTKCNKADNMFHSRGLATMNDLSDR